jgi:hypothetical protein
MKMTNFQCKKLSPLVVGDIGEYCVECLQSTAFGSGRFVNRIPADRDIEDEEGNHLGVETVGSALNVTSGNVIVAMKKFIVTKTLLVTMSLEKTKTFLMVHIVSMNIV